MGIARGRRRGRKFVNFAITAVLAFNRRGFVVRRGSVIVVVAWGRRRRRRIRITTDLDGEEKEGRKIAPLGTLWPYLDFGTRSFFTAFGLTRSLFTAFGLHERVGAERWLT